MEDWSVSLAVRLGLWWVVRHYHSTSTMWIPKNTTYWKFWKEAFNYYSKFHTIFIMYTYNDNTLSGIFCDSHCLIEQDISEDLPKTMFTLDRIASDPSQNVDRIGFLFTLKTAGPFQFLGGANVGTERCGKWTIPETERRKKNTGGFLNFKFFVLYSRIITDVTAMLQSGQMWTGVDRSTCKVFTLERMVFWTVPHSVPFQIERGLSTRKFLKVGFLLVLYDLDKWTEDTFHFDLKKT